ncbi:MAG: hypothetical protein RLO80_10835 [Hyphomonas sp.]
MLKFLVFALLVAAVIYAFSRRGPPNWPPRDDRGDDDEGGPVRPADQIDFEAPKEPAETKD